MGAPELTKLLNYFNTKRQDMEDVDWIVNWYIDKDGNRQGYPFSQTDGNIQNIKLEYYYYFDKLMDSPEKTRGEPAENIVEEIKSYAGM